MAETPSPPNDRKPNHLIGEKSPYLLQHAHNPVDWYPWGEAAFAKAKAENKPIFLSIGYATCHWCHVMERECFEDPEVAALMNATFVNIKVDREERPDIDQVYMTVCQMLTGSGGWPLTIVMTPDGKPFFAGTFFPKHGRFGRPGLMELIPRIAGMWTNRRAELESSAAEITAHLARASTPPRGGKLDATVLDEAYRQLAARFDAANGGFGTAPKFPSPHNLVFLLRQWRRTGAPKALEMVRSTLDAMRAGGIWDHVGWGFHRYSTDARWLVPHFEKMLYDQADLAMAYLEAYQATGEPRDAETVRRILAYVDRDLGLPGGGFASAEDADSEGVEGKFYLWTLGEMKTVLDRDELRVVMAALNVDPDGNWGDEISGMADGTNILHRTEDDVELARELKMPEERVRDLLESARGKLLTARSARPRPLRDDKVLTDWNGLAVAAFARAGRVLGDPALTKRAARAARFLLTTLRGPDGRLLHRWRDGEAAIPAMLDDEVFLAQGCLELHQATLDPHWLAAALELAGDADRRFSLPGGGLAMTATDAEALLVRPADIDDGAMPSGPSMALDLFLKLGRLTGDERWSVRAERLIHAMAGEVRRSPAGHTAFLAALSTVSAPTWEIVVSGEPEAPATAALLAAVRGAYLPGSTLLLVPPGPAGEPVRALAPFTAAMKSADGRPTAWVCRGFACDLPLTDPERLKDKLTAR
ncbi:MAG TPA: thioredoxin domain-containing protein [Acidobacteria bacterium]|nr:thioredoxin domain-containing protein [Acidobacteriota bacterium]